MTTTARAALAATLLLLVTPPLLANGGTVRVSRAPVGPYLVSVMSSPTPLRTGEVDISVLVQDSAQEVVPGVRVVVEAIPVDSTTAARITHPATRQQATNKFFLAAKFDVPVTGEWEFLVHIGEGEGGTVSFRAELTEPGLLDRPWLLAALVLLPLAMGWWLLGRRERESIGGPAARPVSDAEA